MRYQSAVLAVSKNRDFCFLTGEESGRRIFLHRNDVPADEWDVVDRSVVIEFALNEADPRGLRAKEAKVIRTVRKLDEIN